jgi:hypothetical protein
VICPEASRAQNSIAAVSAEGSTVCVLMRRLNSFSIPALSVNYRIASSRTVWSCLCWRPCRSGPIDRWKCPPGAAFSTSSCAGAGSGWGMGRSWGVLPHARRPIRSTRRGRQRVAAHSPQHRPRRDSFGRVRRAADLFGRLGCGLQPVVLARRPHPVQHHSQLARQRHLRLAEAAALGHTHGPGLQGAPAPAVVD